MQTIQAGTLAEFTAALDSIADPAGLTLLEAVLPALDVPQTLTAIARSVAAANDPGHGKGRFQRDKPADVIAARLSAAMRMPVLLHYRLAPAHPFPAALHDVLAAYRELTRHRPASRVVLVGHTAGATLALSALTELAAVGQPLPVAAVMVSPVTDFTFSSASIASCDGRDTVIAAELTAVRRSYLAGADPAAAPQSPMAADPMACRRC